MISFVLDNSVAMRWLLASERVADQKYADSVLRDLLDVDAVVPNLWHLEAANVLLGAEKRGDIKPGESEAFIVQLENLPLRVDPLTSQQCFAHTLALARAYKLSSYDAAYLELALREGLPLATLDKSMVKAATKANIPIYRK